MVREGTGAGHAAGATLVEAHALAGKEVETDATKRALSTFGNPFGLALYDRDQKGVQKPRTSQPNPSRWAIHDTAGSVTAQFADPQTCARTLRQKIEQAGTLSELAALWRGNKALVGELQQHLAKTKRVGIGDVDLVGAYQRRHTKLWTQQTLSPVNALAIDKT